MQYYQMSEDQLNTHFSNELDLNVIEDETQGLKRANIFLHYAAELFSACKKRFSFVFIPVLICFLLSFAFSILNKDWALLVVGMLLLVCACLLSVAECAILYFKKREYDERIAADDNKVKVIKEGKTVEINATQLKCGDRLILEKGGILSADARVVVANNLYASEELIFGKTISSYKSAKTISTEKLYPEEQANMVWSGSYISEGYGEAIVVALDDACLINKIGRKKKATQKSALYNQKNNIGKIASIFFFILSVLLLIISGAATGSWLEALLVCASFLSFFVVEPTSFVTEWIYYRTAKKLSEKGVLIRNIQAFDGVGKEKELYLLPSDLLLNLSAYDEILNVYGAAEQNAIFAKNVKEYFGNDEIICVQSEGETFAVAVGYWEKILPYINGIDDSLVEVIREHEKHGRLVGAIAVKGIGFTGNIESSAEYLGKMSLRCLVLKRVEPDNVLFDRVNRLRKSGTKVSLIPQYSEDMLGFISSECNLSVADKGNLNTKSYSYPARSETAVCANVSQIAKRKAKIVYGCDESPIHTIYEMKCVLCGIERSMNLLYILFLGLMVGSFVSFLKDAGSLFAFPMLMLLPLMVFMCHNIIDSVKNYNQSKLSFVIGGLFFVMIIVSAFVLVSGAPAAWAFSFVFYSLVLVARRIVKTGCSKRVAVYLVLALLWAILTCLFVEINVAVVLLFAVFPAAATVLIDLIY